MIKINLTEIGKKLKLYKICSEEGSVIGFCVDGD